MSKTPVIDNLVTLAKQIDKNSTDFGMIPIDEEVVYKTIASTLVKAFSTISPENRDVAFITSMINQNVKLFILEQEKLQLLNTISRLKKKKES